MATFFSDYIRDLKKEFNGYNKNTFQKDLMAGLTVCAVALPLALAFGVGSGADAAAGLITAIISGVIIGGLSGASFQISGPTGAMTAILISIVVRYGIQGVFFAGLLAGILLLIAGLFKLGRIVSVIPSPVISGFTSGIAIIIALGQIDNFFGVTSHGETALARFISYFSNGFSVQVFTALIGVLSLLIMIMWPKKLNFPSSLATIIFTTALCIFFEMDIPVVGNIPQTLLPEARLQFSNIPFDKLGEFIVPSISIASLAMIESLLCGTSGAKMKKSGERLNGDMELVAQGIGNIIIPFFGGVPSTAAIARTSVSIKSGGQTRLVSIIHAVGLLASMFFLAPVMSKVPLSALAGVLIVTAYKMNDWENIKYIISKKFKSSIVEFFVTMIATVLFDLTIAILAGLIISVIIFVVRISDMDITSVKLDKNRLRFDDLKDYSIPDIDVVYITGPIFFGNVEKMDAGLAKVDRPNAVVLSMRGVPLIDISGMQALSVFYNKLSKLGVLVLFSGVHSKVRRTIERSEIYADAKDELFFWDAEEAIRYVIDKNY